MILGGWTPHVVTGRLTGSGSSATTTATPYTGPNKVIPGAAIWLLSAKKEWAFGCVNEDGSLDTEKVARYLKILKKNRAQFLRQLPYLVKDETGHGQLRIGQASHLPFVYSDGRFNLALFNDLYFVNLRTLAKMANDHGMAFAFCTFDRCHGNTSVGPWFNNVQGVKGWRSLGQDAKAYVKKCVQALAGLVVHYQDENEPDGADYEAFSDRLFDYLLGLGVSKTRLIAGGEFYFKDPLQQKEAIESKGREYRVSGLSVMHHFDDERWAYVCPRYQVQPAKTEGRRFFWSDDGLSRKRTKSENLAFYGPKVKAMPNLAEMECWIESCIAPYPGDNTPIETLCEAVGGIALAGNYELLPDEPVIPPPPVIPEPVTPPVTPPVIEEENMQYTRLLSGIKWKWPPVEIRLWSWIVQNWNQKTIRHITLDGMIVLSAFYGLYQLIKTIVKIF